MLNLSANKKGRIAILRIASVLCHRPERFEANVLVCSCPVGVCVHLRYRLINAHFPELPSGPVLLPESFTVNGLGLLLAPSVTQKLMHTLPNGRLYYSIVQIKVYHNIVRIASTMCKVQFIPSHAAARLRPPDPLPLDKPRHAYLHFLTLTYDEQLGTPL